MQWPPSRWPRNARRDAVRPAVGAEGRPRGAPGGGSTATRAAACRLPRAAGGAWQLNASDDDGGTARGSGGAPANGGYYVDLSDTPVQFNDGIYADIPGTNVTLTVFYD